MEGISHVFRSLFGITLKPSSIIPGETWHPDVRKVEVVHELEGKIGTIYCDLYKRSPGEPGKFDNPAHFTVRCSRVLHDEVADDDVSVMENREGSKFLVDPSTGSQKKYQLPIVVLVTGFRRPSVKNGPTLLSFAETETLFHEMGHALHSVLSRTDFQHVSGTRVPMDFVEVPSIFMEYFVRNPLIISSFAQDFYKGEPMGVKIDSENYGAPSALEILETQNQIQMAILDQSYHSLSADEMDSFDSTAMLSQVQSRFHVVPYVENTAWQVQFSHLHSYGSSYYSYAWSRRWSSRLYRNLLKGKKMEEWRPVGEFLKTQLLGLGGSRSPWIGLSNLGVVEPGEREGKYVKTDEIDLG